MQMTPRRFTTAFVFCALTLAAGTVSADEATQARAAAQSADGYKTATRLGGSSAFYGRVRDVTVLKRAASQRTFQRNVRTVLDSVGLGAKSDQILQILAAADPSVVREVSRPIGSTLEWMALRRGGTKPDVVRMIRWGGRRPYDAFEFVIDDMDRTYTFIVPKDCGNLSLASAEPSREKARRDAEAAERARIENERKAKEEAERKAKEAAAERAAKEEAERKAKEAAERAAKDEAERRAKEEAERKAKEAAEQQARDEALRRDKVNIFVDGAVGKERRVRDVSEILDRPAGFLSGRCAPVFGGKVGADIRLSPKWRIAPGVGVAINTRDTENYAVFAEAEVNRWFDKGYVGTGLGVWDMTHSDTVAPSWLFGFGRELMRTQSDSGRLFFIGQGRLLLDELDDASNNYQFWGGVRYIWR